MKFCLKMTKKNINFDLWVSTKITDDPSACHFIIKSNSPDLSTMVFCGSRRNSELKQYINIHYIVELQEYMSQFLSFMNHLTKILSFSFMTYKFELIFICNCVKLKTSLFRLLTRCVSRLIIPCYNQA